ncbi:helix-turn-helix domain-containing protein [Xanthobacter autotrophicus DSM 431]|uniref:winged helix-turn-helix transcriptional regulator n=1 Tax=Xanthobacter nonsaccharivorans TaxID=3119912 RepID=UPI0037295A41
MHDKAEDDGNLSRACLAEPFLKFFAQEWMSHIIATLSRHGTLRFGQLRRALPGPISARVLSARLKALEAEGYVARRELEGRVRQVEYTLTPAGRAIDHALTQAERAVSPPAEPEAESDPRPARIRRAAP